MQALLDACDAAGVDRGSALGAELDKLAKHVAQRTKALS